MGRIAPDLLVQDATVPLDPHPGGAGHTTEIGREYDLKIANVFHAGDGNLHPNILFDRQNQEELERVEKGIPRDNDALCIGWRNNHWRAWGWCRQEGLYALGLQ